MASAATDRLQMATGQGCSIYVHVPFCVVKCGYCDFNSFVASDAGAYDRFLDALSAELELVHLPADPVSVFIGGGTPTHLDEQGLTRLFAILSRRIDLQACREVSMEANPESVSAAKIGRAMAAGVRRVSMGVQSFAARHLQFLDRAHDAQRVLAAFAEVRRAGCDNVSLDLMFGIPGQTLAEWDRDLTQALALGPDHVSCYNLTIEPGTRLHRDWQRGRVEPNAEEVDAAMFELTRERLRQAGFRAYEVSNFAGRGGPCLHNDHYWQQGDYVGVGPGASSHRRGVRHTNLKALEAWVAATESGTAPIGSAETLSPRQRLGEAIWLGLRRSAGVELERVLARIGISMPSSVTEQIEAHLAAGLLQRDGGQLRLTPAGLLVGDRVGSAYLAAAELPAGSDP